jgi:hypothetical protein
VYGEVFGECGFGVQRERRRWMRFEWWGLGLGFAKGSCAWAFGCHVGWSEWRGVQNILAVKVGPVHAQS